MCGINGGWTEPPLSEGVITASFNAMAHRGPDDSGCFTDGGVFLGNRRLAIIDVPGGRQPIGNEDGTVVTVLNGEIYNYRELRTSLKSAGHIFATDSDTEVLVHLYEESGIDMLSELRGMFAFALWDARTSLLFAARDRFGKKPLYYRLHNGNLVFASELKALKPLSLEIVPEWNIRDQAVYDYLSFGFVPQPDTAFENVHSLPPASWMTFDGKSFTVRSYWQLSYEPKSAVNRSEALVTIRELLGEAVRIRLRSDVPIGVFLSSGIDSSIVAYEAAQHVGESLETFTVMMDDPELDESAAAKRTADFLGVRNTVLPLHVDPLNDVLKVVRQYDQPFADPSAIPSMRIAEAACQHVKVVLNGDGGDEIFAGYRRHLAARYAWLCDFLPAKLLERLASIAEGRTVNRRKIGGFVARFFRGAALKPADRYLAWTVDILRDSDKSACRLGSEAKPSSRYPEAAANGTLGRLDAFLNLDIRLILAGALLVKMDIATMAASLEARSPFMDHLLADYAAKLPESFKISGTRTKPLLRDAYRDKLPAEILRGAKKGFDPPLEAWLRGELKPLLADTLMSRNARVRSYIDGKLLDGLLEGSIMQDRNWAALVYTLLVLELWLEETAAIS